MPLYEYQCDVCDHRFEVIQKFSDAPLTTCEQCGGALQKLLSSPAIQFKGSGWYITDYARASKTDEGKAPAGTEAGASSSDKTGEKKAEGKSEPTKDAGARAQSESTKSGSKTESKSTSSGAPGTS